MTTKTISAEQLADLAQELTSRGGHITFVTTGQSMFPTICHGDQVTIGPLDQGLPRLGEVLLVNTRGGPVLHRLVGIHSGPEGLVLDLLGDAELGAGVLVESDQALGRVTGRSARGLLSRSVLRLLSRLGFVFSGP